MDREPHRVLFVHHRPQPSGGGAKPCAADRALSDEWEAHVLVPGGAAAELFEAAGATVHRAPVPAFTHTWDVQYRGLRWLVAVRELSRATAHRRALRRLLRELRPALVHLNDSVLLASDRRVHKAGVPVVWHLRRRLRTEDVMPLALDPADDRLGGASRRSRSTKTSLRRSHSEYRSQVIPNLVGWRKGSRSICTSLRDEFASVRGVFAPTEGLAAVSRGAENAGGRSGSGPRRRRRRGDQAVVTLSGWRGRVLEALGVPDEERAFDQRISELNLAGHVTSVPFTVSLGSVYRALDLVVFPNQGAGLGRPVLEAAAYGLPAVASGSPDGGGILEPNRTGVLLRDGTAGELAAALRLLCSDPVLRSVLGSTAQSRVVSLGQVAAEVEEVYAGATGRARSADQPT